MSKVHNRVGFDLLIENGAATVSFCVDCDRPGLLLQRFTKNYGNLLGCHRPGMNEYGFLFQILPPSRVQRLCQIKLGFFQSVYLVININIILIIPSMFPINIQVSQCPFQSHSSLLNFRQNYQHGGLQAEADLLDPPLTASLCNIL